MPEIVAQAEENAKKAHGSFEIVESGLPVNWIVSKYPLEKGDAAVELDELPRHAGRQPLDAHDGFAYVGDTAVFPNR